MRLFIIIKLRVIFWFSRLAKAEDDHQVAIAEKLDVEARLKEELEMTKVFYCFLLYNLFIPWLK